MTQNASTDPRAKPRKAKRDIEGALDTFAVKPGATAPADPRTDPYARIARAADAEEQATQAMVNGLTLTPGQTPRTYKPGMLVHVGERLLVPLQYVVDGPNNSRAVYTDAAVADIALSIAQHGQLQAALAYAPAGDAPVFALKEGHTRARALRRLDREALLVEIAPPMHDALEDYAQSRELNLKRKQLSVFDDAMRFRALLHAHREEGLNQTKLAERLRVTAEYMSIALKIGSLPAALVERMAASTDPVFGEGLAYPVATLFDARGIDAADKLVTRIIEQKLSVRDVKALVKAARDASAARAAGAGDGPTVRQRRHPLSRAEVVQGARGAVKLFPGGRIEMSLEQMDESLQATFYAEVVKLIERLGMKLEAPGVAGQTP